jgi:hypothetical protein
MNGIDYRRQDALLDPAKIVWPVHVIGCGGIGSAAALTAAKLGFSDMVLWDDDRVEAVNIPNQLLYGPQDIGRHKAEVLRERLLLLGASKVEAWMERVIASDLHRKQLDGIVISGVDSMKSRRAIWDAVKLNTKIHQYFDGRLGGTHGALFNLNPSISAEIEVYESWLFSDEEAAPLPCGGEAIVTAPMAFGACLARALTRFVRGEPIRNLQFNFGDQIAVMEL